MDPERERETFWRGIECFNRRQFFTCHELLEEIWLVAPEEEKPFYQGIVQVAAAFHHFQKGNLAGLDSLLRAGTEKLRRYPSDSHGIDLGGLLAALDPWLERLSLGQFLDGLAPPTIQPAPRD